MPQLSKSVTGETKGYNKLCSICNSPYREEIHEMKKAGRTYRDIVDHINSKASDKHRISAAGISRHFQHWVDDLVIEADKVRKSYIESEAETLATYQVWADTLFTKAFKAIYDNFGSMSIDISDLERLAKIRVLLAQGDSSAGESVKEVFDRAAKRHGYDYEQVSLFDTEPRTNKNIQDAEIVTESSEATPTTQPT